MMDFDADDGGRDALNDAAHGAGIGVEQFGIRRSIHLRGRLCGRTLGGRAAFCDCEEGFHALKTPAGS
jgi:hypothetical protein